ncbi:MAG: HAD family hydrolase, partial [Acutalibacteraceae bacterium]
LTALKKRGVKTGVVTNKNDDSAKMLIKKYFGNLIDSTLGHVPGLPSKPNPESLLRVMSDLCVEAENTLYFGDSDVDVMTAKNAGVKCVGAAWGFRGEEVLNQAGADMILHDPHKIADLK